MNVFDLRNLPEERLFYKGHDPKSDPRLGSIVKTDESSFNRCKFVIVGCPQDEGVQRNNGRIGARKAPDKIREWLYKFSSTDLISTQGIFDLGNTKIGKNLEETHENQYTIVKHLIELGKVVVVLGGGNDISYPDCKALSETVEDKNSLCVINIDKHFDVRDMNPINSGTPYRFLLNEGLVIPANFHEIGYIPFFNATQYSEYLQKIGSSTYSLDDCREIGLQSIIESIFSKKQFRKVFWGFDIDAITSSDAPGVSSSYPIGFTAEEILQIAKIAGKNSKSTIFEFSEMNPDYDLDDKTAKLVAILVFTVIEEMSRHL